MGPGGGGGGQERLRQEPGPLPLCPADQEQAGEGEEGHEALWILAQARAGHAKTELKMNSKKRLKPFTFNL